MVKSPKGEKIRESDIFLKFKRMNEKFEE